MAIPQRSAVAGSTEPSAREAGEIVAGTSQRPTFIVECSVCHQPWEVVSPLVSVPGAASIEIPMHLRLDRRTSRQLAKACPGSARPGIGMGNRKVWWLGWQLRDPGRPLPAVLDGSESVRVVLSVRSR